RQPVPADPDGAGVSARRISYEMAGRIAGTAHPASDASPPGNRGSFGDRRSPLAHRQSKQRRECNADFCRRTFALEIPRAAPAVGPHAMKLEVHLEGASGSKTRVVELQREGERFQITLDGQ